METDRTLTKLHQKAQEAREAADEAVAAADQAERAYEAAFEALTETLEPFVGHRVIVQINSNGGSTRGRRASGVLQGFGFKRGAPIMTLTETLSEDGEPYGPGWTEPDGEWQPALSRVAYIESILPGRVEVAPDR